jgi:mutator protein MutT
VSDSRLDCKKCGFVFYQNPKTAVNAIVLNNQQEVLLARRAFDPAKGTWDFPGGFVDYGERPNDAIIREMDEELHVKFTPTEIFSSFHAWYPFGGLKVSLAVIVYRGTILGELQSDDDVSECCWFSLNAIPDDLAFPEMKELLETLKPTIVTK